jgi:hypothetical protein
MSIADAMLKPRQNRLYIHAFVKVMHKMNIERKSHQATHIPTMRAVLNASVVGKD